MRVRAWQKEQNDVDVAGNQYSRTFINDSLGMADVTGGQIAVASPSSPYNRVQLSDGGSKAGH